MKNFAAPLLLLFLLPYLGLSQQNYSQYFDGRDTVASSSLIIHYDSSGSNLWQVGKPSKSIFDSAATRPNAMLTDTVNFYPANDTSSFYFGIKPIQFGFGVLAMQWKQKLDMDFRHDGGIIEFSQDTGRTWTSVFDNPYVYNFYGFDPANQDSLQSGEMAFTGTDSTWKDIWLCFDISWLVSSTQSDTLLVRFRFVSDSVDNPREGWMIDNMLAHLTFIHTVNEFADDEYMKVFPNPTSGKIDIETRKQVGLHIIEEMDLINSSGQVVESFGTSPTKFSINIGHHPPGTYLLKVRTNLHTESFRILLRNE